MFLSSQFLEAKTSVSRRKDFDVVGFTSTSLSWHDEDGFVKNADNWDKDGFTKKPLNRVECSSNPHYWSELPPEAEGDAAMMVAMMCKQRGNQKRSE